MIGPFRLSVFLYRQPWRLLLWLAHTYDWCSDIYVFDVHKVRDRLPILRLTLLWWLFEIFCFVWIGLRFALFWVSKRRCLINRWLWDWTKRLLPFNSFWCIALLIIIDRQYSLLRWQLLYRPVLLKGYNDWSFLVLLFAPDLTWRC